MKYRHVVAGFEFADRFDFDAIYSELEATMDAEYLRGVADGIAAREAEVKGLVAKVAKLRQLGIPLTCDTHDYQCECNREFNETFDELEAFLRPYEKVDQ